MNDDFSIYLLDALEQVMCWGIPDDEIPDAANAQARLMAGQYDSYEDRLESTGSH